MNRLVFSGSFDPITNGHVDIIKRAYEICDELIIVVGYNDKKKNYLSYETRVKMLNKVLEDLKLSSVVVDMYDGLIGEYCITNGISQLIRGIRNESDLIFEQNMATHNRELFNGLETIFIMSSSQYIHISSSSVREILNYNTNIEHLVPPPVYEYLKENDGNI